LATLDTLQAAEHMRRRQATHSLDTTVAGAAELEFCARIELCRRKVLLPPAVTGIRSGVLDEAPEQKPSS